MGTPTSRADLELADTTASAVSGACGSTAIRGFGDSGALSDAQLQAALEEAFVERRRLDARLAELSGAIAQRSRSELGAEGLARRNGSSTASAMVASIGLIGAGEAARLCRVGLATAPRRSLVGERLPAAYEAVAAAMRSATIGVDAAHHIISQLDQARPRAGVEDLEVAERELVSFATAAVADDVRRLAIRWRDALDADGIEPREEALIAARSLKRILLPNGMKRFVIDLDPLSAAYLDTAIDAEVTSMIRAVRFTDLTAERADGGDGLINATSAGDADIGERAGDSDGLPGDTPPLELGPDPRTLAQMSADVLVDLARHALSCESTTPALAAATVVVRMSEESLVTGLGEAQIDGGEQPISAGTARRLAAEGEIVPMVLGGDSEVLDLGRSRRMFSKAQRIAFAERDGGCALPGCDRPPSYTEAHHIRWWRRDHGPTDLDNGVLLCTRDHHRVHARPWEIRVERGRVWFIPPPEIDPLRRPRLGGRAPVPRRT